MKLKTNLPAIVDLFTSDNPTWAKIAQLVGLILSTSAMAVLSDSPATFPVAIIKAGPYAVFAGNLITLLFQAPKKSIK